MSSKYATTMYNRLERVKSRTVDLYSRARSYHWTADYLTERLGEEVWSSVDFKKLGAYERGYMRGVSDTLRQNIWLYDVDWRLGPASGPTRYAHDPWTEEMSTLSTNRTLFGGHFWKGTDKPFTTYANLSPKEAEDVSVR